MAASRGVEIDTSGIKALARDLGKIDRKLRGALVAELRSIGNDARDAVRRSHEPPFETGRKRGSVRTSVRGAAISLYSLQPDAAVWNWGGKIAPRGSPIQIPRTEFVSGEVAKRSEDTEERLEGILDATAARYGFH